jgi:hypothetical protein
MPFQFNKGGEAEMANVEHLEILERGVKAWDEWRGQNFKVEPDLSSATFAEYDLENVNFARANLSNVDLTEAYLSGASLTGANLRGAKMIGTRLDGADITEADLTGAHLGGALLFGADLSNAILDYTTFTLTDIGWTLFGDNDLSKVRDIEDAMHWGPSIIGVNTLIRSNGELSEGFLRAAGVPEEIVTFAQSISAKPIEFYSCFISYSHKDKSFARRLHDQLQRRGIRCWLDEHQLLPGHDIYEEVYRGIRMWDKVLLCCSKHSLSSWWVDNEIQVAFDKEQQLMKDRGKKTCALVPLNLDGYLFTDQWKSGKATQIKSRLAADFKGWETNSQRFDRELERLVKALRTDEAREIPPESRL